MSTWTRAHCGFSRPCSGLPGSSTSWTPRPRTRRQCCRCPRSPGSPCSNIRSGSRPSGPRSPRWGDHDLVFPSERGTPIEPTNLSRSFARLREAAGLPGVRLHDLRHTVVSLLMELGVPPHVVQAIARHADVKITLKVYAHANLDAMRQALGKLDGRLS
ncbi:tyrosine-type recombinase/integrase [Micromonospora peucetia]|uniref:tyrosine-type recombinase/integrase n=1 Tax=Micromonospora peucetia TaxID=47871 RepID=UPI002254E9A5|nr:tyrosine-type recombinase/integrase [Micromonospora peucetia]MCX4389143.1 tyrosine-type recombinase/integrase [Micromonospora peucetia]